MRRHSAVFHKIHNYFVGGKISQSEFSSVRHAFLRNSEKDFVIKMISKQKMTDIHSGKKILFAESILYPALHHKNICSVFEKIETQNQIFLVLEKHSVQLPDNKFSIIADVSSALYYLHNHFVAHLDLKVENLVSSTEGIKLIDFGFAQVCLNKIVEQRGSHGYAAPEIFSEKSYDPFKADMWSFGVLIYVLFAKKLPFGEKPTEYPVIDFPKEASFLLERLLVIDPQRRASISEIIGILKPEFKCRNFFTELDEIALFRTAESLQLSSDKVKESLDSMEMNEAKIFYDLFRDRNTSKNVSQFMSLPISLIHPEVRKILVRKEYREVVSLMKKMFIEKGFCWGTQDYHIFNAVLNTYENDICVSFDIEFTLNPGEIAILAPIDQTNASIVDEFFSVLQSHN